jgi:hypothetical protein
VLFGIVAGILLLVSFALPLQLQSQAARDRVYYAQFREAAVFAASYANSHGGKMPSDEELQRLGNPSDGESIWATLSSSGGECTDDFRQSPNDRFTLWFWRGEWGECYAYPSGRTTLAMSLLGYLRSGLGAQLAVCLIVGIAAAGITFKLMK